MKELIEQGHIYLAMPPLYKVHDGKRQRYAYSDAERDSARAKAKADAKKTWDEAHMTPSERAAKMQEERDAAIAEANARTEAANARYEATKKH